MKHNFNKTVSFCGSCTHFNHNSGCFSFCLIQEKDVFEGDTCDMHTTSRKVATERENKITQYMGTIFDRGDGKANFPKGEYTHDNSIHNRRTQNNEKT